MSADLTVRPVAPEAVTTAVRDRALLKGKKEEAASDSKTPGSGVAAKEAADGLRMLLKKLNTELRLEMNKDSGDIVVKIVDPETRQVLKQIPSEEMVQIRERMSAMAGVLLRTRS